MPLLSFGYDERELQNAYDLGYTAGQTAALSLIAVELERWLPSNSVHASPQKPTANELATSIIQRLSTASSTYHEVRFWQRWSVELARDPLFAQLQRTKAQLGDTEERNAQLKVELTQVQRKLVDEECRCERDVRARDQRITELNALVAQLIKHTVDNPQTEA